MRPDPTRPPGRRRERDLEPRRTPRHAYSGPRRRCPYLEQILKERAGPFGWLTRFRADCHVDRRTHAFTGRHPAPPCITDPTTCSLYQSARADEDRQISRYSD